MKKIPLLALAFGILFLFFIQSAGTLVESIYILDLLHTSLDTKALGLLFFFTPILALPFFKRSPRFLMGLLFALLFLARGLTPSLTTAGRLTAAGIAIAASLGLVFLLLRTHPKGQPQSATGLPASAGLALAVGLSTLLRTVYFGVEYSLVPAGAWVGWILGLLLGGLLWNMEFEVTPSAGSKESHPTAPLLGVYLILTLVYFVFSAPAVIARWTQGSYPLIVGAVSLLSLGWAWLAICRPEWSNRLTPRVLLAWNALFTLSLTGALLAQRVAFPTSINSPEVVLGAPAWWQQVPTILLLLLFPVIFADLGVLFGRLRELNPSPGRLAPGILLGGLALILLTFFHIFTNVWAYVPPVSPLFRNAFWLPHFLPALGAGWIAWRVSRRANVSTVFASSQSPQFGWPVLLLVIFLSTTLSALPRARGQESPEGHASLVAMTYNVQQFNDRAGEKSFDRQLAIVRQASPDILAMQEIDSNRISLNNNDYVRYFSEQLGYYTYYGPTPVTGTFGTAILSKYPLENPRTAFVYSDNDETGIAEAEVLIGGKRFTIYCVHPDGSDEAMLVFAQTLLRRGKDQANVIALGDYNLRDTEEPYQLIASVYTNAWESVYPSKISPEGVDMSGRNRIDHIFFSRHLQARNPVYILEPASATDHPVHWTEITWPNP
jgi:endonuclease/exonuclease/phosphatase family metal-dependent hydrolase